MTARLGSTRRSALLGLASACGGLLATGPLAALARGAGATQPLAQTAALPVAIGGLRHYRAGPEDTLVDIALRHRLGFVELKAANPEVDVWLPGAGTEVLIPEHRLLPDAPQRGIVINLSEMRLYHYRQPGAAPISFAIGIGREGRVTPTGETSVVRKTEHPAWYPPASIRAERPELPSMVPPGPENPLGTRALYLGWQAYLIHGTSMPYGVGRRVSAGCIRMFNEDVELLYPQVAIGTPVTVVDQEVKLAWLPDGELYLEVNPSQAQADQIEVSGYFQATMPPELINLVVAAAGAQVGRLDWATIERAGMERRGYPLRVTR